MSIFLTMIYAGGIVHHIKIKGITWWEIVLWPCALGISIAEWGEDYAAKDRETDRA